MKMTGILLFMLMYFPVTGTTLQSSEKNLALGQATAQKSIYKAGFSSRAVDGDRNSDFEGNSCTHTERSKDPWWSVDLRRVWRLKRVVITNRDEWEGRLTNMSIGTVDVSPLDQPPTPDSLAVCASPPEPIPAGETTELPCDALGRYLVILLRGSASILTLCEVEVYADNSDVEEEVSTPLPPQAPSPFSYRPSVNNPVTQCSLSSLREDEQERLYACFRDCFLNPCCKAVNSTSCEQSYVKTEALDFVKEGDFTKPKESCGCVMEYGNRTGHEFSMFPTFEATEASIRSITVFFQLTEGIKGIHVAFAGSHGEGVAEVGFRTWDENNTCILEPDERITDVIVYTDAVRDTQVLFGITFMTPRQTCGPFGKVGTNIQNHTSGHQLLYISGYIQDQVKNIKLHYDYDCKEL